MFKREETEREFEELGYVVLDGINKAIFPQIQNLYGETKGLSGLDSNFYTSIWSDNIAYKEKVDKALKGILSPFLDKHLKDYKMIFSNFMVKKSAYSSSLQPHQDWSFVREPQHESITVWIPLMDVSEENGALEVLPKSNKLENYKRARFMDSPFSAHNQFIEENLMKSIPLQKGEALFVNSRTIHASPDNLSGVERVAVSVVVCPKDAPLVHYLDSGQLGIKELEIEADFFIKYSCFDTPTNEPVLRNWENQQIEFNLNQLINK